MNDIEAEMEKRFEEEVLEITSSSPPLMSNPLSNSSARAHPAALFSPQAVPSGAPSGLLSPPPFSVQSGDTSTGIISPAGSRYVFEADEPAIVAPRPMSPILDPSLSGFGSQRPMSAQDFNNFGGNNFDPFRPFTTQPGLTNTQEQTPLAVPERPMSSMEIDSLTFKNDVANLVEWLGTLHDNQQRTAVDNILSNLSDEALEYAKTRIGEITYSQRPQQNQHQIVAPQPLYQSSMQEPATLDAILNGGQHAWPSASATSNLQRALSPVFASPMDRSSALVHEAAILTRPRSADPYHKTPSKTRHLYHHHIPEGYHQHVPQQPKAQRAFDITNLAQQLSAQQAANNGMDYANVNNLKLSALSTINSRAQLDSGKNRKHNDERGRNQLGGEDFARTSSVPPPPRMNYYEQMHHPTKELSKMASLNSATKALSLEDSSVLTPHKSPQSPSGSASQAKSPAINPKQITNPKLLADVPAWLKTLRLHKYTPCLQDTPWKELIYFDDQKLAEKGVTAMGARGKLLKAFEVVKQYYEDGLIE